MLFKKSKIKPSTVCPGKSSHAAKDGTGKLTVGSPIISIKTGSESSSPQTFDVFNTTE